MLEQIPVLDPAGCREMCERIDRLRAHWIRRDTGMPFATLGAASYLDSAEIYRRRAAELNPVLEENFADLYKKIYAALRAYLEADVTFEPGTARPGFHLFHSHPMFQLPIASIHFDLQHHEIAWVNSGGLDFDRTISFTLALELPQTGGGLHIWEGSHQRVGEDPMLLAQCLERVYVPYEVGSMLVHSGKLLHQIAPGVDLRPVDRRITLQGHGVALREGGYRVFW